ncbi:NAD(P)/FAD-dependent oxidoreductase [Nocardioides carbamazepini]|uniref:NAD(P)/FAD-dependent oxidoreductase n=2 Tax=Nocardioides TaxID=1839 RepID=UPI00214A6036|nr:NAD(P)/FAD-dependent oxidoreductase [Nocardioides carbamazepini]MCR1781956.1 NAD(P)/FAD-dependent oxidoreductase [Nocardioides carbamazepini]
MNTSHDRLVVVGAGLAGLRAAETARLAGFTGSITLVGAEELPPYDRPPLSESVLAVGVKTTVQTFRTVEQLSRKLGVEFLGGRQATALQFARRTLELDERESLCYDRQIIATRAHHDRFEGSDASGVTTLRTAADAYIVREALDRRARVVVIGAGLIGSEVASAARARGMSVVLLDVQPLPLVRAVGLEAGRICAALQRQAGTDLRVGVEVEALESHRGHVAAVALRGGTTLAADLVVVDRGAQPATRWLIDSGIMLHPNDGGIVCGPDLRTSVPDVLCMR